MRPAASHPYTIYEYALSGSRTILAVVPVICTFWVECFIAICLPVVRAVFRIAFRPHALIATIHSVFAMNRETIKTYRHVRDVPQLTEEEVQRLAPVEAEYAFRANSYYLGLIDWTNPDDPLRRLVIPSAEELCQQGHLDASREADYTVARGLQHKYRDTVLMLVTETCDSYCRYCFRKRLTMRRNDEGTIDPEEALEYIRNHTEIRNVLLTGGDPLILATNKLERIFNALNKMSHVRAIRVGTKVVSFRPQRISQDRALLKMFQRYSTPDRRIYIMAHFSHPNELSMEAHEAIRLLKKSGCEIMNQCPIIRGVNDNAESLERLLTELMAMGVHPYYLFIGRPTLGNRTFAVPITQAWSILQEAVRPLPGLARTVRLAMSHHSGKLEVTGVDRDFIHLYYHRAADPANHGRHLICERDDLAIWFDDLTEVVPRSRVDRRRDIFRPRTWRSLQRFEFPRGSETGREN